MLLRALTAVALLGAFLAAVLLLDKPQFAVLLAVVLAVASHEWSRLLGLRGAGGMLYAGATVLLFCALAWWLHPWQAGQSALQGLLAATAAFWLVLIPLWIRRGLRARPWLAAAGLGALPTSALAALTLPPGQLLLVLGLVWVADTAAYLAGRAWGRHKLAPSISPGKTWEGVAGGTGAALIYAIICALLGAPLGIAVRGMLWGPYLAAVVLLCAVSIVGDLFESALKRFAGAKDSGSLLPGHGGVLDRIDSAMSTLPVGALLLNWIAAS